MTNKKKFFCLAAVIICACSKPVNNENFSQETEEALQLGTQRTISIANTNGDIEIFSSDTIRNPVVKIIRTISGSDADDARNSLENVKTEKITSESEVGFKSSYSGDEKRNHSIKYRILIPTFKPPLNFVLETQNGKIFLSGIDAENLQAHFDNGSIHSEYISVLKEMKISGDNGNIFADFTPAEASSNELGIENGNITIAVQSNADATVEAASTNGSITNQDLTLGDYQKTKNRLSGRLGNGRSIIKVKVENGNISLKSNGRQINEKTY